MNLLSWIVLVGGVPLAALLGWVLWRARHPSEEPIHRFLCPHCGQRLGYPANQANQAGHLGICPRCRRRVAFERGTVKWGPRRK
jgi:uncharacterized protein YlaI